MLADVVFIPSEVTNLSYNTVWNPDRISQEKARFTVLYLKQGMECHHLQKSKNNNPASLQWYFEPRKGKQQCLSPSHYQR